MTRLRLMFSKRRWACFVRHVELPQLLGRMARRAGFRVELTQGFSPHPHIVMGPALPVGVLSLGELAEIWLTHDLEPQVFCEQMNLVAPDGFCFLCASQVEGSALNKVIQAAKYWLNFRGDVDWAKVHDRAVKRFDDQLYQWQSDDQGVTFVTGNPSSCGVGQLVKDLIEDQIIDGWPDVMAARLGLGLWDQQFVPLMEAADE